MALHIPDVRITLLSLATTLLLASPAMGQASTARSVERGRYLVSGPGDCSTCHSPKIMTPQGPVPDTTRLLSGHPGNEAVPAVPAGVLGPNAWGALGSPDFTAWAGPWGVSFTANLTPDATGLGSWTRAMFIRAMRTGRHMGAGRPILPPMPWPAIRQMSDADLGAIYDYLRTLKPVHNIVPAPLPPPHR